MCMLPWSHLFYSSDGNVYPCCRLDGKGSRYIAGKTTDSVDKIWNSDVMKNLRKSFMEGNVSDECNTQCFNSINPLNVYLDYPKETQDKWISETSPDGTFRKNFITWNLVASNVCNYKCAYCTIVLSSRFYEDRHLMKLLPKHSNQREITQQFFKSFPNKQYMLDVFKEHINMIERIHFAGGETHLQDGYLEMLDMLIEAGRTDTYIEFYSNMSGFNFQGRNFLELLSNFPKAHIVGSLDTLGKRAEYIRYGTSCDNVERQRVIMMEKYPKVNFIIQPVVSNMSIFTFPDFHLDWYNKGYLGKDMVRYIPLEEPEEMHVSVMPDKVKEKVLERWKPYVEWISDVESTRLNRAKPIEKINQILNELKKPPIRSEMEFKLFVAKTNITRNIKFGDIFTEFS